MRRELAAGARASALKAARAGCVCCTCAWLDDDAEVRS